MKNLWIALLPLYCMVGVPAFAQLYNNGATITISSGATVVVNSSSANPVGLYNQGTVENNGKLLLSIVSGSGEIGLQNSGVFHNNACAELSMFAPLNNSSTFINTGLFRVNTADAHTNTTLTNNGIILYPQGNPIPNVTNNEIIISSSTVNNCYVISPAFDLGSQVDFVIIGIFTDEAATMPAGTYITATNTFTPTSVLAEDTYTFYVKIEDDNGDCTRVAPWQLTVQDCCDGPQAICKTATIVLIGNSASLSASDVDDGSTVECGLQSMTVSPNAFDCSHVGTPQMVTLTVTDVNNNSSTCTTTVTVLDNTPPTITCPATQTLVLDANCSAILPNFTSQATTGDNCGVQGVTQSPAAGTTVSGAGNMTVTLTVTDVNNNTANCTFTVNKVDNTPPTIQCINQTVTFNGEMNIPLNAGSLVDTTDNCGVATILLSPGTISATQVGQIVPVTVTVTDINGNAVNCTSQITVSGLPAGWSQNPDGVGCAGGNSIDYNSGTGVWTATSTNCFYGPPFSGDATGFAQRTLCGDGSITAQVTSINGNGWAGIMMRETNAAGAKKAQLTTNLSSLSRREFRLTTNGAANPQQFPSQSRYWLRVVRAGNQFTMFTSPNGSAWYLVAAQNIEMNSCIQMGLVATNYNATSTVTATFANVSFAGSNVPVLVGVSAPLNTLNELTTDNSQHISDFHAYPNPTSGELNLDLTQYLGRAVRVELYSLTGQLLRLVEIEEVQTVIEQLDLSDFRSGMYMVKVKSRELPDVTRRVVIAR